MSADRLRAAAKVLRERAEAAYTPEALTPWSDPQFEPEPREAWPDLARGYLGGEWGEYVAMMQPPVAFALADWLAKEAWMQSRGVRPCIEALRVADLILGGEDQTKVEPVMAPPKPESVSVTHWEPKWEPPRPW